MTDIGPNGCTCGNNGDCNCPFVPSGEPSPMEQCGHGVLAVDWCETCDGYDEPGDDQDDEEECTCSRAREDIADARAFPCDACGRMVR